MRESAPIDYSQTLACDVAIAGAGLGGLAAGAILARAGKRVVVVDKPPWIGSRAGSVPYRDYWIDGGHRDGRDTADLQAHLPYGSQAAKQAGTALRIAPVRHGLRIHLVSEEPGGPSRVTGEVEWGVEGFARMAVEGYGCPPEALDAFTETLRRLSAIQGAEREAAMGRSLGDWLAAEVADPVVRHVVLNMVKSIYAEFPERASLARLIDMLAIFSGRPDDDAGSGFADDDEMGGMGGLVAPFARALEAHGGRIILEHEPAHVTFEGDRATGLVALSVNHFVLRIRAQQTIVAYPVWDALEMLPPERRDPGLVEISRRVEDHAGSGIGWVAGLSRMPTPRSSGKVEDYDGWNRLLVGPERTFSGGFHFPSLGSRRIAPEGKHLLHCFIMRWTGRGEERSWDELEATLARAKSYLHEFYGDLEDCREWDADQYIRWPAMTGWYWAPVERHPVRVPGCENLYIASATVESGTGPADISAHGGLQAAQAILGE